jgi:hypothetical protein
MHGSNLDVSHIAHTSKAHHIMLPHSTFNIKQNARSQAKPEEFSLHPIWKEPVTLIKLM